MGAKKGNKNGRGAKGRSGRKSGFQERADAARLMDLITKKYTIKQLKSHLKKDELDFLERRVLKAHTGDQLIAAKIIDKLFPTHLKLDDQKVIHRFILD